MPICELCFLAWVCLSIIGLLLCWWCFEYCAVPVWCFVIPLSRSLGMPVVVVDRGRLLRGCFVPVVGRVVVFVVVIFAGICC